MAINKKVNLSEVKEYIEGIGLPKGGYVLKILGATTKENRIGQYVEIEFDIAEGPYKGYFKENYENQNKAPKKWVGKHFLNVPSGSGTESDEWTKRSFKTFISSIEKSNPGYKFDWDEQSFVGLVIGGIFNMREYKKDDGSVNTIINFARACSVDTIRSGNYKLPNDKTLDSKRKPERGFEAFTDDDPTELPFK